MKVFFFTGRNANNLSGMSWKVWKIERRSRSVIAYWGPAVVENRQAVPAGKLQSIKRTFKSEAEAEAFERARIDEKLQKGYERRPKVGG